MSSFAKLGIGNKILKVEEVSNDIVTTEQAGVNFLNNLYNTNDVWKQTFNDGTRKNYAGIGYKYNETLDAFIPPKPFSSWTLNETTCQWEAPTPKPDSESGKDYKWNETTKSWDEIVS
tara:strand:+ start:1207 stop:1560 length:354 start_codon:yes stop_codon:yes gene_type:complete